MGQWTGPQNALDPHKYGQWLLGQKIRHNKEWWTCWIMLQEIILSSSSTSSTKEKAVKTKRKLKPRLAKGEGSSPLSVVLGWLMAYRSFPKLTRKGNSTQLFPFSELVLQLIYASWFLKIQPKAFKSVFLLIFLIINTLVINHWEESQTCPCAFVDMPLCICEVFNSCLCSQHHLICP